MTFRTTFLFASLLVPVLAVAAGEKKKPDPALLTVNRIFGGGEFASRRFGGRWLKKQDA